MIEYNYSKLLRNMLKVSKNYANLFNGKIDEEADICFFETTPVPDEIARVGITKIDGRITFYFKGSYFSYYASPSKASIKNTATQLKKFYANPYKIVENFKSALAKPLERYLVNKELKNLEKRLLK